MSGAYRILDVQRSTRPPVIAKFDVQFPSGVTLHACTLVPDKSRVGRHTVRLPRVPIRGDDGRLVQGPGGKVTYRSALSFSSSTLWHAFVEDVLDALRATEPDLFDAGSE